MTLHPTERSCVNMSVDRESMQHPESGMSLLWRDIVRSLEPTTPHTAHDGFGDGNLPRNQRTKEAGVWLDR